MYSKITTIEVRNFMCFKHEIASFDDKNILNFKGFNGQGKSAFLKAAAVCLMNVYPTTQASFISYGEDYFRIVVSFDDGVRILRDKYITGQSLYEMYRNGELVYSTKVGNKLSKVSDVPDIIKDYLALVEVGNLGTGYLNFQTRKEPSWLTETTGSENYTSLNVILKSGEISRASAMINSDKNELNSAIAELEQDKQSVEMELITARQYSPELLTSLKSKEVEIRELTSRVSDLNELWDLSEEINSLSLAPKVEEVEPTRYSDILGISSLLLEVESIPEIPELLKIENQKLIEISQIADISNKLDDYVVPPMVEGVSLDSMRDVDGLLDLVRGIKSLPRVVGTEIEPMSSKQLTDLKSLITEVIETKKARDEYMSVRQDIIETGTQLSEIVKEASKHGMRYIKCNNCGAYMRVNVGGGQNA